MSRKPVLRVDPEELPAYTCNECWFFESIALDHGACYGIPPFLYIDEEGEANFPRAIVLPEDRGCIHFKPRHKA